MKRKIKSLLTHPFLHLFVGVIALVFVQLYPAIYQNRKIEISRFNTILNQKEKIAVETLQELKKETDLKNLFGLSSKYKKLFEKEGIAFFILQKDKQVFWTNRSIVFSNSLLEANKRTDVVKLKNGWYQYIKEVVNDKSYLALILIKRTYEIQNDYLSPEFHKSFGVPKNITVIKKTGPPKERIKSIEGVELFSLKYQEKNSRIEGINWSVVISFFVGYLLIVSFLSKQTRSITVLRKFSPFIVLLFIIASKFFFLYSTSIFPAFFEQKLFSPTIYAQSTFLPSLGDLLITAILFSLAVYYLARFYNTINLTKKGTCILFMGISATSSLFIINWLEGLVKNSKINFDINYLLDLNEFSFIGIFSIILLFIFEIILVHTIIEKSSNKIFKRSHLIRIYWGLTILSIIIGHFLFDINMLLSCWLLVIIITFSFTDETKTNLYRSIFIAFTVAIVIAYGFILFEKEKEGVTKEFVVKTLSKERDPITEYLFGEIKQKVEKDTMITHIISNRWDYRDQLDTYIIEKYFGGFWNKYDVSITLCSETEIINLQPQNIDTNCLDFFQKKIDTDTEMNYAQDKPIHFVYSEDGSGSYISKIKLEKDNVPPLQQYLFIEFLPKVFSKSEGYPELLLNEEDIIKSINLQKYSFAKYKKKKLVNNSGNFNYAAELKNTYRANENGFVNANFGNFNHLLYYSNESTVTVLSSPKRTIFNYITTISYFFIISGLTIFVIGLLLRINPFYWKIEFTDFSTKIQLFIIVSIFLSFVLFGWGTSYYIQEQYLIKNKKHVAEKVQSVLIELEHKLGTEKVLSPILYDYMTNYLIKFSNVFFTDINLYDQQGELLSSSRPEIFERGLISKRMDTEAFKQLHIDKKSTFIHDENIGTLNYLSAYVPFRNEDHEILAYLNLPYFSKQNELESELSSFFTALINVYALIALITTIIAVLFANYISAPVRMIKNKISALQLDKSYELINWESNDEIGALVSEYNKKVEELQLSASMLAKSERESAWREMAKQVAHEIKNPLTPMKLSIQHLQRLASDKDENMEEKLERTAKTLIAQIDSLTNIADEFSNFAKMPKTNEQVINIVPIIETTIDLYKEENVHLEFINKCPLTVNIVADKDEISRALSNLIKNAIQAIPEDRKGKIDLTLQEINQKNICIAITDNGTGISADKQSEIFSPSFTTKNTGMGLGLAMVKNIVQNANGKIHFETKENIGTSFYIELPIAG